MGQLDIACLYWSPSSWQISLAYPAYWDTLSTISQTHSHGLPIALQLPGGEEPMGQKQYPLSLLNSCCCSDSDSPGRAAPRAAGRATHAPVYDAFHGAALTRTKRSSQPATCRK